MSVHAGAPGTGRQPQALAMVAAVVEMAAAGAEARLGRFQQPDAAQGHVLPGGEGRRHQAEDLVQRLAAGHLQQQGPGLDHILFRDRGPGRKVRYGAGAGESWMIVHGLSVWWLPCPELMGRGEAAPCGGPRPCPGGQGLAVFRHVAATDY